MCIRDSANEDQKIQVLALIEELWEQNTWSILDSFKTSTSQFYKIPPKTLLHNIQELQDLGALFTYVLMKISRRPLFPKTSAELPIWTTSVEETFRCKKATQRGSTRRIGHGGWRAMIGAKAMISRLLIALLMPLGLKHRGSILQSCFLLCL